MFCPAGKPALHKRGPYRCSNRRKRRYCSWTILFVVTRQIYTSLFTFVILQRSSPVVFTATGCLREGEGIGVNGIGVINNIFIIILKPVKTLIPLQSKIFVRKEV